jgi:hypothetical protein
VYDIPLGPGRTYSHREYLDYTVIVKAELENNGQVGLTLLPVYVESGPRPTILKPEDPRFEEVVKLIQWSSEPFGTRFELTDGGLRVLG